MNKLIKFLAVFLILMTSLACQKQKKNADKQQTNSSKPNVIVILADDAGYADFGFQGPTNIKTPKIDKLASEGIVFSDAHVSATVCSPSRAGLMTGRYQQRFGHESNGVPKDLGMDPVETTMGDAMKSKGYATAAFGKWHLGTQPNYHPNNRGFDEFYGFLAGARHYFPNEQNDRPGDPHAIMHNQEYIKFNGYLTTIFGNKAVDFINKNKGNPFFIYLAFNAVHGPMEATKKDLKRFEGHPRKVLAAMTWSMDQAVGRVMDTLDKNGLTENTIIFFLSDNGGAYYNDSSNKPLKGWKGNEFEGGQRVPFFVTWKGHLKGNQHYDKLVSSLDIFPTAYAVAGGNGDPGKPLDGVNLLPYLQGDKAEAPHQRLYWRKEDEAGMRDGKWKLIKLDDYGYVMYDLDKDLGETNDLKKTDSDQFDTMKEGLNNWEQQLMEPLWHESKPWRDVTWDIHKALMNNKYPKRLHP